jgi:hypothetical protein
MNNERKLKDPSLVPTKGWQALQEDGVVVKGLSFRDTFKRVEQYRRANGLPVPANIRRLVEEQICKAMTPQEQGNRCEYLNDEDTKNPPALRNWLRGPRDLLNFAKAAAVVVGELAVGSSVCVSKEEATRRAEVCAQCPFNIELGNCWGCGELGKLFRSIQGGLSLPLDARLHSCDRCGCNLRTKVWVTEAALDQIEQAQELQRGVYPEWCWRNNSTSN